MNHPEDCAHKQCPWNDVEEKEKECEECFCILEESEVEQGLCGKHLHLRDTDYE